MRTSYVSKNAGKIEKQKKLEEEKKQDEEAIKGNLSKSFVELKGISEKSKVAKPVKEKKKGKGKIFLVVAVVICVIAGSVFVMYQNKSDNSGNVESSITDGLEDTTKNE